MVTKHFADKNICDQQCLEINARNCIKKLISQFNNKTTLDNNRIIYATYFLKHNEY